MKIPQNSHKNKSGSGRRIRLSDLPEHYQAQIQAKINTDTSATAMETTTRKKSGLKKSGDGSGSPPHDLLWDAVSFIPGIVREFPGAVPGRKFRIDIAHPELKIAIEVDGWQYHGKYKESHEKDRERQNLLSLQGWTILRFSAGQIFQNLEECLITVLKAFVLKMQKPLVNKVNNDGNG